MERLTVKYDNEWLLVITKEWIKEDLKWSDYCKKYAIPKLAEYENFMEENGFESLEDIKHLQQKSKELKEYYSLYEELLFNKATETDNIELKIEIENLKDKNFGCLRIKNLEKEILELKQQLAEKDKLLENAFVPKFEVGDVLC